jgi:hypothetical protein
LGHLALQPIKHAQGHVELKNIIGDEELVRWMGLKALG